jgi:tellurite resistance protein TehA-like permease
MCARAAKAGTWGSGLCSGLAEDRMHAIWNCFAVIGILATAAAVVCGVLFLRQINKPNGWNG